MRLYFIPSVFLALCLTACETKSVSKDEQFQNTEPQKTENSVTSENDEWYKCWDGSEAKHASECPIIIDPCWDGSVPEIGDPCPAVPLDKSE